MISSIYRFLLLLVGLSIALPLKAEFNWISGTLDNDLFIGNDNGYTNGLYLSLFETGYLTKGMPSPDLLVAPLLWTLPKKGIRAAVNAYMIGQTMSSPSDITIEVPDDNEIPYAATLSVTNSYVVVMDHFADLISTTIGIVGPSAFGEESQKQVHVIVGADEPLGWDTQLHDEPILQLTRGRIWRFWQSESGRFDFLPDVNLSIGNLQSSISSGITIRYGHDLASSFSTNLFNNSRILNPSAINNGWYLYAGIQFGFIFNNIYADGNTFRDSRSIEIDPEFVGTISGFAYSWASVSLSFAVIVPNLFLPSQGYEQLDRLTRFGTMTVAWRI